MANTKEIQDRIKSINDTLKITNAMYMISSSKLKKSKKMLADTEPYFFTLQSEMSRILRHLPDMEDIYFKTNEDKLPEDRKVGYIVITADKGLAGSYNHNILKMAEEHLKNHPEIAKLKGNSLTQGTSLNREDSFVKNYKSSKPSGFNRQKAYLLKLEKVPDGEFGLIHGMMPVSQLKQVCHRYGVSINDYLVACFVWSVYQECFHGMPNDMPVRVAVPVNLRPYFDSVTTKNFFVMISAEFRPQNSSYTFEEVLKIVTDSINSQISKEHLEDLFSYSVSNQKNILMRPVPLFIKNLAMKAVYTQSALANTTTITNIGNIKVEPEYEPYITGFYSFIPMSKGQPMKGTICSYKDTLVFTFSSILADTMIQRSFFKKLVNDGVEVTIETNGEYYD